MHVVQSSQQGDAEYTVVRFLNIDKCSLISVRFDEILFVTKTLLPLTVKFAVPFLRCFQYSLG